MRRLFICLLVLACCFNLVTFPAQAALSSKQISPAEIVQTAKNYLKGAIPLKDINLDLKSRLAPQRVPAGKVELKVDPINPKKWGGHTGVPVQIFVDGKRFRTVTVFFQVQVFQKVAVVTHPLRTREAISSSKVALKRVDISGLSYSPYTSIEDLKGARTVRYLSAKTILTKNDVEEIPLVLKGKPVTIRAKLGLIEISTLGKALKDGRMGDLIQVQNTDSRKKLFAKVVGPALVEIPNKN